MNQIWERFLFSFLFTFVFLCFSLGRVREKLSQRLIVLKLIRSQVCGCLWAYVTHSDYRQFVA